MKIETDPKAIARAKALRVSRIAGQLVIMEVDWESLAAYITLAPGQVSRTEERPCPDGYMAVDYDRCGKVLGVEIATISQFVRNKMLPTFAWRANLHVSRG